MESKEGGGSTALNVTCFRKCLAGVWGENPKILRRPGKGGEVNLILTYRKKERER